MLDTNKIIVENVKATIMKVKDWVLNLYPITYTDSGSIQTFKWFNKKGGKEVISLTHDGTFADIDSVSIHGDNNTIDSRNSTIIVDGSKVSVESGYEDLLLINNNTTLSAKNNNPAELIAGGTYIKETDKTVVNADNKIAMTASNSAVKIEGGDLYIDGKLHLGYDPNLIPVGTKYDVPYSINSNDDTYKPVDSNLYTRGVHVQKSDTYPVSTGTDWQDKCRLILYQGSWLITCSVTTASGVTIGDGNRLAMKVVYTGDVEKDDMLSRRIVTGTGTRIGVQGCGYVNVPVGGQVTARLNVFQTSSSTKDCVCTIKATRI